MRDMRSRLSRPLWLLTGDARSSPHTPRPSCGHGPAWLSTSTARAATLDSAYPQSVGERILPWFPSTDGRWASPSPSSPQDRLELGRFELATRHRRENYQSPASGRRFPIGASCCRNTLEFSCSLLSCRVIEWRTD